MKYVYITELGRVFNAVETGSSENEIPNDAIKWPENLNFSEVFSYGYNQIENCFIKVNLHEQPSENHEYDFNDRQWVFQQEKAKINIRFQRNLLLGELDNILCNPLRWQEITEQKKAQWAEYRQSLLNVPQQEGFPENVVWPTKLE